MCILVSVCQHNVVPHRCAAHVQLLPTTSCNAHYTQQHPAACFGTLLVQDGRLSVTTKNVGNLLILMRTVILQDAPFLQRRYPDHPIWQLHPEMWDSLTWREYSVAQFRLDAEVGCATVCLASCVCGDDLMC